jgi:dienelactone hydrolase
MVHVARNKIIAMKRFFAFLVLMVLLASGCQSFITQTPARTSTQAIQTAGDGRTVTAPVASPDPGYSKGITTVEPTARATPPRPTSTFAPTSIPTLIPTPDPFAAYTIENLLGRSYGGGELRVQETLATNSIFTRMLISYPSDGLKIYGFIDIPQPGRSTPPYPMVIALHGYIDPAIYNTVDYTTHYADSLAWAGYIVLHPNLRGFPPSDNGDDLFRVGMAVDVLNLITLVKEQAGKPGPLELADPQAIGLWGHSMGGGVVTRVLVVSPDVRAAVLYGAMSGDDQKNYERIFNYFSNQSRGVEELKTPLEAFDRISPINFLDRIQAAVSINHGKNDKDVPLAWSLDLCQRLQRLGKSVECFTYPGQSHTFHGAGDELFIQRMVDFYNRVLKRDN